MKVITTIIAILIMSSSLSSQEPGLYIKKDTWFDTLVASREKLAGQLDKSGTKEKSYQIWRRIQRDFSDVDTLLEMTMDNGERIWEKEWPVSNYKVLARRYAKAVRNVLSYMPSDTSSENFAAKIDKLVDKVDTIEQLNEVRKIYYEAYRAMEQAVLDEADENIRKYRMGKLIVRTEPNAKVKIEQLRHDFLFGAALNEQMWASKKDFETYKRWYNDFEWMNDIKQYEFIKTNRVKYQKLIKDNFNYAVHENAAKWFNVEPQRGEIHWTLAERMSRWCTENDIKMRGHCIIWGQKKNIPPWQENIDKSELRRHVERRCKGTVNWFAGIIDEWDLNNEMLHSRWYREQLGDEIVGDMFRWAKQANPDVVLTLNDYNILNNKYRSELDKYLRQIKNFLDKGYPVGGINCQGHSWYGETNIGFVKYALDELGKFKLGLKISEYMTDNQGQNPDYAAAMLAKHLRLFFGHPAVEAIVFGGFWEGFHLSPAGSLWKKDFSPEHAARIYRSLVFDQWWTKWEGAADSNGLCEVPVFYGRYKVAIDGKEIKVNFPKSEGPEKTIDLKTQKSK